MRHVAIRTRPADEVEVRLSPLGDNRTLLELEHASVADLAPDGVTDAIVGVAVGWELAMVYLGRHLRHELPAPPLGLGGRWFEPTAADAKLVRASVACVDRAPRPVRLTTHTGRYGAVVITSWGACVPERLE